MIYSDISNDGRFVVFGGRARVENIADRVREQVPVGTVPDDLVHEAEIPAVGVK